MADESETRLFDIYNAILMKGLKITQNKRAQQKLPIVERFERRGIITKARGQNINYLKSVKLRPTAD